MKLRLPTLSEGTKLRLPLLLNGALLTLIAFDLLCPLLYFTTAALPQLFPHPITVRVPPSSPTTRLLFGFALGYLYAQLPKEVKVRIRPRFIGAILAFLLANIIYLSLCGLPHGDAARFTRQFIAVACALAGFRLAPKFSTKIPLLLRKPHLN